MPNIFDVDQSDISTQPVVNNISPGNINAVHPDDIQTQEEKYSTPGQQLLTGIEGAAQGIAGPVATAAEAGLSKLGVPGLSPEEQEARASANPITRYGSEAASFGAGAFTGVGLPGMLGKIGQGAAEATNLGKATTTGAKIAGLAVSGGAELAALDTGNEISKAINQDPGQTLGNAAVHIGLSGLLGAAGGAALGSVSPLWKSYTQGAAEDLGAKAAEKAESVAGSIPKPLSEDEALAQAIQSPKEKGKFLSGLTQQKQNADEIRLAGQYLDIPVTPGQTSTSDYVQSMDSALSQSPTIAGVSHQQKYAKGFEKIGNVVDGIMDASQASPYQRGQTIKDQIQNTVDTIYQPLKEAYAARGTIGESIALPDEARLKQYDKIVELSQKFAKANPDAEKMVRNAAEGLLRQDTVSDLDEYLKVLSAQQRNFRSGATPDHYAANALGDAISSMEDFQIGQIAKQGRGLARQGVEGADEIAKDIINQHKELKAKYSEFKEILGDLAGTAKLGKKATTAGGLEHVLENIPNERLVEKMFDPKNSAGLAKLRDNFPEVFKTVVNGKKADILAKANGDVGKVLKEFKKLTPEIQDLLFTSEEKQLLKLSNIWVDAVPKNINPSGTSKGMQFQEAIRYGPLSAIINNAKDIGIKTLLKFATPEEIEVNKTAADYVNNAVKGQKTIDRATKNFFNVVKGSEIVAPHLMPDDKSRERLKDHLEALNTSPDSVFNVGGNIGHYMPNHAYAVGTIAASAINYFNSLKPKQAQSSPLDAKPPIDKIAEAKYNRALDIAQQPLLILHHAKNGSLQAQDIVTLNTIYPSLRGQIASKLSEHMIGHVDQKKFIPYAERQSLSMLIGSPLDSTMAPGAAQSIMHSSMQQEPQAPAQGPSHKKASGTELTQINKVNKMYSLPNEQRELNRKS